MWKVISKHITAVFLIVLTFTASMALIVVWKVHHLQREMDVIPNQVSKILAVSEIKEKIMLQAAAMDNFILTGREDYLTDFRKYVEPNRKLQRDLLEKIRDSRKSLVTQLIDTYEQYLEICENYIVPEIKARGQIQPVLEQRVVSLSRSLLDISDQIQNLRKNDTASIITNAISNSKNATKTTILFTLVGSVLGLALSIGLGSRFIRDHKIYNGILNNTRNMCITIDERGVITSVNKSTKKHFEIPFDAFINRKFDDIIGRGKLIGIDLPVTQVIQSGTGVCNMEKMYETPDGWQGTLNVDVLPLDDRPPCGVLVVARDISERKVLEEKLYSMTLRDGLTRLFNHSYLKRKLQKELAKAKTGYYPLTFILIDIDNFKYYNDRFGHLEGDNLLKEFSRLLVNCVRSTDIVGRYGGDEFAVILPHTGREAAMLTAERIRAAVEEYPFPNRHLMPQGKFTVSVGASIFPDDGNSSEDIIRSADEAMYRCKRNSKNEVQLYSSALKNFQRELKESEKSFFNVVQVMLGIINAKDRDTYLHLEKVAEYVEMIGNGLKLGEKEVKHLKLAAILHDVGKLEIPRHILTKAEPLTRDEWSIIKQHPKWGANMVRSMQSFDSLIPMILYHHERYDGTGYPNGLKGEDIPLGSRIIAVADSFDAITNSRPYRKALSYEEAMKEIIRCSGTQFDPLVVDVFQKTFYSNRTICLECFATNSS